MVSKIIKEILYKIGTLVAFIGIFWLLWGSSYETNGVVFYLLVDLCGVVFAWKFYIMILDLILYIIFHKKKKSELSNKERLIYLFKEKIKLVLNLYLPIGYFIIYIYYILNYEFIVSFCSVYGLILSFMLVRKNIENIKNFKEKSNISKVNLIKILANLCIVANIFIIVIFIRERDIECFFYYNNETNLMLFVAFLIIELITLIISLKIKPKINEEKELKLQIIILSLSSITFFQTMPCMLIIIELLKELRKYKKVYPYLDIYSYASACPILFFIIGFYIFIYF